MASTITPYLFFSGQCEEALQFYAEAVGARLEMKMRYDQSPEPVPPGQLQPGFETKIMHASFWIGDSLVMASDGCDDKSQFGGFRLAISVATKEEAHRVFNALAAEGSVLMPLVETFWSPCFGMLTDKFDLAWMISVPGPSTP